MTRERAVIRAGRRALAILVLVVAGVHACARRGVDERAAPRTAVRAPTTRAGEVQLDVGRVARVALDVAVAAPLVGATSAWRVTDQSGQDELARVPAGVAWRVERNGGRLRLLGSGGATAWRDGPLIVRPATDSDGTLTYGGRRWRGELWLHAASAEGVTVVNRVPIEAYLRGVVPLELNTFAPSDRAALEAQSVAARSYVYSRLPEFQPRDAAIRQAALPYDLRATTNDQVYGGVDAERGPSDGAIRATAGLVLRYEGAVVTAPYHSACGGGTAEPSELWRSPEAEPWLRRTSDRIPGTADRYYCDIAPRFRWTREWDESTLRMVLERYLRSGSGVRPPLGAVRDLKIESRTGSGRVNVLAVPTGAGRAALRGNDIRFALRTVGGDILPSTYFSVDAQHDDDGRLTHVTLRGNGNGHGVGMCQWGAVGRARAGQDFRAILRAYFAGASVERAE